MATDMGAIGIGVLANAQQRSCEDLLNMFTCSDLLAAGVELDIRGD